MYKDIVTKKDIGIFFRLFHFAGHFCWNVKMKSVSSQLTAPYMHTIILLA